MQTKQENNTVNKKGNIVFKGFMYPFKVVIDPIYREKFRIKMV